MNFTISKDEINVLPLKSFEGEIHIAYSEKEAEAIVEYIKNQPILGFDTESKPSFKKGENNPISLIQISTRTHACIFKIDKEGITKGLKDILEDEKILKIGQEPSYELKKLNTEHGLTPRGFADICKIAAFCNCTPRTLKALAAIFLQIRISKQEQTSNWNRPKLTEKQVLYAATDAWVTLEVYLKMKSLGLTAKINSQCKLIKNKIEYLSGGNWKDVETKEYKTAGDSFKNVIKRSLIDDSYNKLDYELRYFEIAKGGYSCLEKHKHTHTLIILRGKGIVTIGKDRYDANPNDIFYIPPDQSHQLTQEGAEPLGYYCIVPKKRDRPVLAENKNIIKRKTLQD
ncbi:MAG: 3'-5' exonuclease [uncultured bacterium]|nr:MAG: 3'-5' exonuclease [uncultured bacterium]